MGAVPLPARRVRALARPEVVRLGAFVPLAVFAGLHWGALISPSRGGDIVVDLALSVGAAGVLLTVPAGATPLRRWRTAVAVAVAVLAASLLAAGVPLSLLDPRAWGELVDGMAQGISATPAVTVPYRGVDEWARIAIVAGGTGLIGLAALLAFWPRRSGAVGYHVGATAALCTLYVVPIVERGPDRPFLDGAAFCVLLAGFLWAERLRRDQLAVAAASIVATTAIGGVVAPRLDAGRPWIDYESLAEDLQGTKAEAFSWDHSYGPLHWPRDGREMLRITARFPSYWKTSNLDTFDGVRWIQQPPSDEVDNTPLNLRWLQRIRVVDRGLRSTQFVGAGATQRILDGAPRPALPVPGGTFVTATQPLGPGDSYEAMVYDPKPTDAQLRRTGTDYPAFTAAYAQLDLPVQGAATHLRDPLTALPVGSTATVRFSRFGDPNDIGPTWASGFAVTKGAGEQIVSNSPYARLYALARRIARQAGSPYAFALAVRERVQTGAAYDESPPPRPYPLATFLFSDRRGYCQQFSGVMAMMLRMGGVPARVASGFSPGSYDAGRNLYTVRDTDAHSWVEAYFPPYGWVTLDPTPAASPAASQLDDQRTSGALSDAAPKGPTVHGPGDRPFANGGAGGQVALRRHGGDPTLAVVAGVAAALVAVALGVWLWRRRVPFEPLAPEVAELQRALFRTGRKPSPDTTLTRLETVLGGSDAAIGYVRAVRDRRFRGVGTGPTAAQRRALRRQLGDGLGWRGRLVALWAVPPRPRTARLKARLRRPYTGP